MRDARHIREVVAGAPTTSFSASTSVVNDRSTSPATSPSTTSLRKSTRNQQSVLELISKLAALSATKEGAESNVEELLEEIGFVKDSLKEEHDMEASSGSFSFNIDTMSSLASMGGSMILNKKTELTLSNFSCDVLHFGLAQNISAFEHRDSTNTPILGENGEGSMKSAFALKERRGKLHDDADTEQGGVPLWRGHAAVLFVDLSGYSKVAAALTVKGGAHALSSAVNSYFESILSVVVNHFHGDVLTFAGDALVVCWPCNNGRRDLQAALLACACALELQRLCGVSPVQGTDLFFRLHIGITFGEVESQVLLNPGVLNMQKVFHYVSGSPLEEMGSAVEAAASGEICISDAVYSLCSKHLQVQPRGVHAEASTHHLLLQLNKEKDVSRRQSVASVGQCHSADTTSSGKLFLLVGVDEDYEDIVHSNFPPVRVTRSPWLEENVVPPAIARRLRQGFKPHHVAEMRFLCVLFVKKAVERLPTDAWFSEVQRILDHHNCPVVQVIHDDKGTHLIAAVNLYRTEREASTVGIHIARMLVKRETGCIIGVACGVTFCGITGGAQACRWDITGPAVVRACRLMQHGVERNIPAIFDGSIYDTTTDVSQLQEGAERIALKGSKEPVKYFVLSEVSISATASIMSSAWSSQTLHREKREKLSNEFLNSTFQRGLALLTGPVGVGKKTLVTIALEQAGFMFTMHHGGNDQRPLNVLASVTDWFTYHADPALSSIAKSIRKALDEGKITASLTLSHTLIERVVELGIKCCLVILYVNRVDFASIQWMRMLLTEPPTSGEGKFFIIGTAYPLYGVLSPEQVLQEATRTLKQNERYRHRACEKAVQFAPLHLALNYPDVATFAEAYGGVTYYQLRKNSAQTVWEATGGCLSLIRPLVEHIREHDAPLSEPYSDTELPHHNAELKEKMYLPLARDCTYYLSSRGEDYLMTEIQWPRVAPAVVSRFAELYDALPPRMQLICRVVASLSTTTGSADNGVVFIVLQKFNTRFSQEKIEADLAVLEALRIFKPGPDPEEVMFTVPAMLDLVYSLLTTDQDRMLKRTSMNTILANHTPEVKAIIGPDFIPLAQSMLAKMCRAANDIPAYQRLMQEAWQDTLQYTANGERPELRERMEQRLTMEHRRFPELLPATLFVKFSPPPRLHSLRTKYDDEFSAAQLMPHLMQMLPLLSPPMALGALAGEFQILYWMCGNNFIDLEKEPGRVFIPPEVRKMLKIDVAANVEALRKFEELIPKLTKEQALDPLFAHPQPHWMPTAALQLVPDDLNVDAEGKMFTFLQKQPADHAEAQKQLFLFVGYYQKYMLPRRDRMVSLAKTLISEESMVSCKNCALADLKASTSVGRALLKLTRPEPYPDYVLHEAVLDLATSGWVSKYYHVNLQLIRDQVLNRRTIPAIDFKAMLLSLRLFGEHISYSRAAPVE